MKTIEQYRAEAALLGRYYMPALRSYRGKMFGDDPLFIDADTLEPVTGTALVERMEAARKT